MPSSDGYIHFSKMPWPKPTFMTKMPSLLSITCEYLTSLYGPPHPWCFLATKFGSQLKCPGACSIKSVNQKSWTLFGSLTPRESKALSQTNQKMSGLFGKLA